MCPILIVPFHLLSSISWIYSGDNNFFNSALLVRQTSLCKKMTNFRTCVLCWLVDSPTGNTVVHFSNRWAPAQEKLLAFILNFCWSKILISFHFQQSILNAELYEFVFFLLEFQFSFSPLIIGFWQSSNTHKLKGIAGEYESAQQVMIVSSSCHPGG